MNLIDLTRKRDYDELMDIDQGWLSRRVYWDQDKRLAASGCSRPILQGLKEYSCDKNNGYQYV